MRAVKPIKLKGYWQLARLLARVTALFSSDFSETPLRFSFSTIKLGFIDNLHICGAPVFPPDYYLSPILICDNKAGVIEFASARVTLCF